MKKMVLDPIKLDFNAALHRKYGHFSVYQTDFVTGKLSAVARSESSLQGGRFAFRGNTQTIKQTDIY